MAAASRDRPASPEKLMTNYSNRVRRWPRWRWPASKQSLAAIIVTVSLVLLAAACGGSPSSAGRSTGSAGASTSGGTSSHLLAFASCMRSRGVPSFPDPSSSEKFPGAQQLGVSDSQFQTAYNTCKHLLPNGGGGGNQTQLQQEENALLPFARCMRSHGISDWPDPSIHTNSTGQTAAVFDLIGTSLDGNGFDAPRVQAASNACEHVLPTSIGGAYGIMRSG